MFTGIIIGVLGVASVAGLLAWTRSKGVSLSWYTWLVFASWLVYTLGVVAGIGAFVAEGESGAAGTFALTFLVPTVLGLVILRFLVKADEARSGSKAGARA